VCEPNESQEQVYEVAGKPIIENVLEGFNGTILAYGQTSSGKTFTMQGDFDSEKMRGVIPRIVSKAFQQIKDSPDTIEFTVKLSMVEIYNEKLRDLLNPAEPKLKIVEDKVKGILIQNCTEKYVASTEEVYALMKEGNNTDMNAQSSRSHSIVIFTIRTNNTSNFTCKVGKLFLVDLAGSEKIGKTNATGNTLTEAKNINKSLTMLGRVIHCLTSGATHIPYRDSKLTRLLQDSLGGNSKTCLIITASPSAYNSSETLGTCRFGNRAKTIKNNAVVNKEYTVAELKLMIQKLEMDLEKKSRIIENYMKLLVENGISLPSSEDVANIQLKSEFKEQIVDVSPVVIANINEMNEELANAKIKMRVKKNKIGLLKQDLALKDGVIKALMKQQEEYITQIADKQILILECQRSNDEQKKNIDLTKQAQLTLEAEITKIKELFNKGKQEDQAQFSDTILPRLTYKMDTLQQILMQQTIHNKVETQRTREKASSFIQDTENEKSLKKKVEMLEKRMEQLCLKNTQLITNLSELNYRLKFASIKEEKKQQHITMLDEEIKACKSQLISMKVYQQTLLERLTKYESTDTIPKFLASTTITHRAQCVKSITGGKKSSSTLTQSNK
jgi:kinesin family member 5